MKKNTMIDLFCGAGVGAIGFKKAGFDIVYAVDNNKHAVNTYNLNIGNHAEEKDIRLVDFNNLPEVDFIAGGFPCQSFSFSGNNLGENCPEKGDLADYFYKAIAIKKPKAFLIENVKGLTSKNHIAFFNKLLESLKDLGYEITSEVINCLNYEVPQKRQRVFVVGIRKDLNKKFNFPEKSKKIKVLRDSIGDLPEPDTYQKGSTLNVKNHYGLGIRNDELPFIDKVPVGGNWRDIPVEDQKIFLGRSFYGGGGRTGFLRKMSFDEPALTITSIMDGKFNAQIIDNKDKYGKEIEGIPKSRRYTVRECLRLQTVPDSFYFPDSVPLRKQYERCSGIPSIVAEKFAIEILKILS